MSRSYPTPSESDFQDFTSLAAKIASGQAVSDGVGNRTTNSITGGPTYAATAYTVSDILQGTLEGKNNEQTLLITNFALTNHLKDLYDAGASKLSSFSTAPGVTTTGGAGGAGGVGANFDGAGNVSQSWVESLPAKHENGAIIWNTSGKGSREMHLGTSDNIDTDIAQHKQYAEMKPEWKHPWNMDRAGGPIGGGAKIYQDVNAAETILGESKDEYGLGGAFGFLAPEEEQFYISMAWPYKGTADRWNTAKRQDIAEISAGLTQANYKGRRILVYCVETKKACVCTPGDWGPHPYFSNGATTKTAINGFYFGLAPDVHYALGSDHGKEFIVKFVSDSTPLGPYTPQNAQQGLTSNGGGNNEFLDAAGGFVNTVEEMMYAGEKLMSHPNWLLGQQSSILNGFAMDSRSASVTPAKNPDKPGWAFYMPSLLNWIWHCMQGGFIFGGWLGGYGFKMATFNQSRISNHGKGGAIDIGKLGHTSMTRGEALSLQDLSKSRPVMEALIDYMGSLPRTSRPTEIGGPYATSSPQEELKVYLDPGHIHFGFTETQCGQLISALKPRQAPQGIKSGNVTVS